MASTAIRPDVPPRTRGASQAPSPAPVRRLSPLDAAFLYFERPTQRMQVGCLAILEGPVDYETLVETVADRLCRRIPRYRQRPVRATLDLDRPAWEEDASFDVRRHLHHVALPSPSDESALRALVDQLFATPFDPDHPLWEAHLIDGLSGGKAAMLWKMHHCMIDGISGAQVLTLITDPVGGNGATAEAPPAARDRDDRQAAASVASVVGSLLGSLAPSKLAEVGRQLSCAVGTLRSLVTEPSTPLPFNGPLSDRRRTLWTTIDLDDVMAIRSAAGCKVNDVVLAIIAGALHRYLEGRGVATDQVRLRILVPVSVREEGDRLSLGNLVTAMLPTLPVGHLGPQERLRRIAAEMDDLKQRGQARAAGLLVAIAGALPAPVEAVLGRLSPDLAFANTICTNVPGPRDERALAGQRILAVHPLVPLFLGMGLEFAVMSYAGRLSISAVADAHLVPDPEAIAAAIAESAGELRAAFREAGPPELRRPQPLVGDLMTHRVATVTPGDTLLLAYRLMRRLGVRHVPVVDGEHRVIGILSHRDILAAQRSSLEVGSSEGRVSALSRSQAEDVMERHVSTASEDEPAAEAGTRMMRRKIGCLPVVSRSGRLVGIVTAEDYLRWATDMMAQAAPGQAIRAAG